MSGKDNKTTMQMLLVASGFALILLYLYFTKGACWEMSKCSIFWLKVLISAVFVLVLVSILIFIWNSDKKESATFFFNDKSIFYVSKNCSQIPDSCESVVVCTVDDLQNIDNDKKTIKDIYVLNPTGKVSAKALANFGGAKIHFCKLGKTFCIEKIIDNDAAKNK